MIPHVQGHTFVLIKFYFIRTAFLGVTRRASLQGGEVKSMGAQSSWVRMVFQSMEIWDSVQLPCHTQPVWISHLHLSTSGISTISHTRIYLKCLFAADIFLHYRFLDICWVLGGMVCSTECGCVNPQVSMIQDAS